VALLIDSYAREMTKIPSSWKKKKECNMSLLFPLCLTRMIETGREKTYAKFKTLKHSIYFHPISAAKYRWFHCGDSTCFILQEISAANIAGFTDLVNEPSPENTKLNSSSPNGIRSPLPDFTSGFTEFLEIPTTVSISVSALLTSYKPLLRRFRFRSHCELLRLVRGYFRWKVLSLQIMMLLLLLI